MILQLLKLYVKTQFTIQSAAYRRFQAFSMGIPQTAWNQLRQFEGYLGDALTADISTSCPNLQISPVCHGLNILVPFVMV